MGPQKPAGNRVCDPTATHLQAPHEALPARTADLQAQAFPIRLGSLPLPLYPKRGEMTPVPGWDEDKDKDKKKEEGKDGKKEDKDKAKRKPTGMTELEVGDGPVYRLR